MSKSCTQCSQQFTVTPEDLAFYDKVSPVYDGKKYEIPAPTLCPDCRAQRRLSFRNERHLYHRKCDLTGKQLISMYSTDKPNKVYDHKAWWSDRWDALDYGREYNPKRSFFEQFNGLNHDVPHMNVMSENNENSDYCNLTANGKNNYLVFESSNNEDCLYGYWLQKCADCSDTSFSHETQLSYEVDNCYNCYNLKWSQNCTGCRDSAFLYDCIGCSNCFLCSNLRQKEYYFKNKQYSPEEYREKISAYQNGSFANQERAKKEYAELLKQQPHRAANIQKSENCSGDYIRESQNCAQCFHAHLAQDCKYAEHVFRNSKDNMDVSTVGRNAELCYEAINTAIDAHHDLFTIQCWSGTSNLLYCVECFSCQDCFGCVGLRKKKYCILNKQYTKEEYEKLVPQIIKQMRADQEWGEFFPMKNSQFGYNETVASEQFPLNEEQARKAGANWFQEEAKNAYEGEKIVLPALISEITDDILKKILTCDSCAKNYKIIPQELDFYRKNNIAVPHSCPDCRHKSRIANRNPNRLHTRPCTNCKTQIQTTYAADRPEKVYCEPCYIKEIY